MELCKRSLHDVIQGNDLISAQDFTKYARQLADGMQYMHSRNIAHRDLKSEKLVTIRNRYFLQRSSNDRFRY